jgi:TRAP-type C4-dicarboxylate transport system substrate-binding protein
MTDLPGQLTNPANSAKHRTMLPMKLRMTGWMPVGATKLMSAAGLLATLALGSVVQAQSLPKTKLNVIGSISSLPVYKDYEVPFWTKTLAEKSGGAVTAEIKGFNEMGLKGPEVMRLMSQGTIEMGATVLAYLASDDPMNEAVDIAGLATDVETARRMTEVAKPMYERLFREKFGSKLLGIGTYPAQVIYCNAEIKSLADLKGKKVRVGGRSQSELMEALGASPVTMAFGEVVPALQNKTVDCGITGTLSGNIAKWHEVTTHLYSLAVSWGQIAYAVNLKTFEKLDPGVQKLIETETRTLEKNIWDAAELHTTQGFFCNAGVDPCTLGTKGKMTLVRASDADKALLRKIVTDTMLPKWAARCSADCVAQFNDSIGKAAGVTARK